MQGVRGRGKRLPLRRGLLRGMQGNHRTHFLFLRGGGWVAGYISRGRLGFCGSGGRQGAIKVSGGEREVEIFLLFLWF